MAASSEEHRIQLDMIQAITQSQSALARILNQVADIAEHSDPASKLIKENIRMLSVYQLGLCGMVTGFQARKRMFGTAASPWLHPDCRVDMIRTEEDKGDTSFG